MTVYPLVSTTLTWHITFPGIWPRPLKEGDYSPGPYARAFALSGFVSVPGTIADLAWCSRDLFRITGRLLKQGREDMTKERSGRRD